MDERTALVTGSTGYLGTRLVAALRAADGWRVRASGRRPRPDAFGDGVEYVPADLADDGDDLLPLVEGVTHVFHLAGASSSRSGEEEMQRANVGGTRRLVAAAGKSGVERFLHMSTTAVYGEEVQLPLPVGEDVEPHPSRGYGKAKWGAEEEVWSAVADGLPALVLRPVSVYGPGAVKLVASAVLDVAIERYAGLDQVAVYREPVEQRLLHIDDLIDACLHLVTHPEAVGRAFNVTSDSYPTSLDIAGALAEQFGMGLEVSDDPDCGLSHEERSATRERMLAAGMTDDILLSPERFRFMRKSNRNNRLSIDALASTGFRPQKSDAASGIAETVSWYREHKWIL